MHCAKKVVSNSPEPVDFAIRLKFFEEVTGKFITEFNTEELGHQFSSSKRFLGLVEKTFGLINTSLGLPEGQAVKLTFCAPWDWHDSVFFSYYSRRPKLCFNHCYMP